MPKIIFALLGLLTMLNVTAPVSAKAYVSERIIVNVQGEGPDVILVPGLTSNPRVYDQLRSALPGYRYHLIQVRGFSGTVTAANVSGDIPVEIAAELARYIEEQKLHMPALIGHSLGGTIGMTLASRHPDTLGRLMVVDMLPFTGAFFGAKTGDEARAIISSMQQQWANNQEASQEQMVSGMVNNEAERLAVLEDSKTSDPAFVARTFVDIQATDLREALYAVKAPITVLYVKPTQAGSMSDEQFNGLYKMQYANAQNVTLIRIPDAAHFIMLDAPDRFAAEVRKFLVR